MTPTEFSRKLADFASDADQLISAELPTLIGKKAVELFSLCERYKLKANHNDFDRANGYAIVVFAMRKIQIES